MRAVVQRVAEAKVVVDQAVISAIGEGLLVLLGVSCDDTSDDVQYMVDKIAHLRIFPDAEGKMNLSVAEVGGEVLVVSQFTLYGDCRKGRRPSFSSAAKGELANALYQEVVSGIRSSGLPVQTGEFGADMQVHLINDGPVTLLLDSSRLF